MSEKIGNAKGSVFIYAREYIIDSHGMEIWDQITAHLSEEDKLFSNSKLSPNEWYPVYLLNSVLNAFDNIVGSSDQKSIIPITAYIAEKDLSPVFNLFVNIKDPNFVLQNIPSIWNRYFDTGTVKIEKSDTENKNYQFSLEDGVDDTRYSGQAICRYGTVTWIETALRIVGAENIRIDHVKCRYENDDCCLNDVRWD